MTTKFPQPKFNNWEVTDGWVFPDYKHDPNFTGGNKDLESIRSMDNLKPINSFEFQQGIIGQYRNFYGLKMKNVLAKSCYKLCITSETLRTKNLSQEDRLCARECLISSEKFEDASRIFLEQKQAELDTNNSMPIENTKFFNRK